jgi:aspartyl-tRNA(Asn)/glutamyl-tRNA(Gln) amidotransferase subunit A
MIDHAVILGMDAHALADGYAAGWLDPVDVARVTLDAAAVAQQRFSALTCIDVEGALDAARYSAARWRNRTPLSPLDGVPMTFKDSFHVNGLPRWHGSAMSTGAVSTHDAAPVRRAREAGIVIVGKTSTPDYGLLMSGLSSHSGTIRNPWNPRDNPSGSSAGAAACLASGVGALALGTDMVGSVRLPAAMCGLAALYPTQGRVAYDPPGAYRGAGPMARSVRDATALLTVVGRHDPADHTAFPGAFVPLARRTTRLDCMRIAVLPALSYGDAVDEPTRRAVEHASALLNAAGARLHVLPDLDVSDPDYEAVYWTMVHKGATEILTASEDRQAHALPFIRSMCLQTRTQSALFMNIQARRIAAAVARLETQLEPFDLVLSPALPVHRFGADEVSPSPERDTVGIAAMSHMGFACWFNQMGRPAGTVPVLPLPDGCPVSVQLAGRRFDDARILDVLALLERARNFDIVYPVIETDVISRT